MGHEDRERKFEQALARHLRGDGARARNDAEACADVRSEPGETELCPDAGTLAAFHEGSLANQEMNATTEHIAGCSRCQQVLLHLEATDDIPLPVAMENELKIREPVLSTVTSDVDYAARQKPGATNAGQPQPALKTPMDISEGRGFKALRWAAPVGAIAAGLLIWFVVREGQIKTPSHSGNVQVALEQPGNERPALPVPPPTTASRAASSPSAAAESRPLSASRKDHAITRKGDAESDTSHAGGRFTANLGAKSADPSTGAILGDRDLGKSVALAQAPKVEPSPQNQSTDTASPSTAPVGTLAADLSKQSAVPAPSTPSGASANTTDKKAKAARVYTTQTIMDEVSALPTERDTPDKLSEKPLESRSKTVPNREIVAPGGVIWRLGFKGQIERSVDGGASWVRQHSGVKSELLAGSAPSESVCWIIGRESTILKTTDGGAHWTKVAPPDAGEITGIQASDATHAIVYAGGTGDIPGRFATKDGGATWFRTNK